LITNDLIGNNLYLKLFINLFTRLLSTVLSVRRVQSKIKKLVYNGLYVLDLFNSKLLL